MELTRIDVAKEKAADLQKISKLSVKALRIIASKIEKPGANIAALEKKLETYAPYI